MPVYFSDKMSLDSSRRVYTDEGFLHVPARIGKSGTQRYLAKELKLTDRPPNDVVVVYRPPGEVFDSASMASFSNKPVTNGHPEGLVTAKTAKQVSVGHTGLEVTRDGIFMVVDLFIVDEDAIKDLESGKTEVSGGYEAHFDATPGITPEGERYDVLQKTIKGNHVALVIKGRAGPSCKVADHLTPTGDKPKMANFTADGVTYEAPDQAAQVANKLVLARDAATTELSSVKDENAQLKEKLKKKDDEIKKEKVVKDGLQAKLDVADAAPSVDVIEAAVAARVTLLDSAKALLPALDWAGKTDTQIMTEVITARSPTLSVADKSPEYVSAVFDALASVAPAASPAAPVDRLGQTFKDQAAPPVGVPLAGIPVVDTRPASIIARDAANERSRLAWQNKGDK